MAATTGSDRTERRPLTSGQQRVLRAVVMAPGDTYADLAAGLGVSVNTLKTQLRRIRRARPSTYAELLLLRSRALAERHQAALKRAEEHSRQWHRKEFYRRYGFWPKERRRSTTDALR